MSDFPNPQEFSLKLSENFIGKTKKLNFHSSLPAVIKREKAQYLYDLDGNKYADFDLHNGSALCGHTPKTVSGIVKDALSLGFSGNHRHTLDIRVQKTLEKLAAFQFAACCPSSVSAFQNLIQSTRSRIIGVNSDFIKEKLAECFSDITVEKAQNDKSYDMLIFEPIDFDGSLKDITFSGYQSKLRVWDESRTAFRTAPGFVMGLKDADFCICSGIIASGMDLSIVLSAKEILSPMHWSFYQSQCFLETVSLYYRKASAHHFPSLKNPAIVSQRGSVFNLKKTVRPEVLLPFGVYMKGKTGFLCTEHTDHDIKRLLKAIETSEKEA